MRAAHHLEIHLTVSIGTENKGFTEAVTREQRKEALYLDYGGWTL